MQLPRAMRASWSDPYISNTVLIGIILLVTLVVIALRFFWIAAMLRVARDTITGQRRKMTPERWRSAAVMTFGGPKGTITLSLMFTIPYYIAGGAPFPMRDELIFIASGVIIVTLLLANFLLPLLAPNRGKDPSAEIIPVTIDVLRATVEELTGRITPENRRAILMVIDQYTKRIGRLQQRIGDTDPQGFEQLQIEALHWEKEFVRDRLADTKAHPAADTATQELNVETCERMLDQIMNTLRHTSTDPTSGHAVSQIRGRVRMFQRQMSNYAKRTVSKIRHTTPLVSEDQIFARTRELQVEAIHHVIGRLIDEMGQDTYNTEHCSALLLDYRRAEASLQARPDHERQLGNHHAGRGVKARELRYRTRYDSGHVRSRRHQPSPSPLPEAQHLRYAGRCRFRHLVSLAPFSEGSQVGDCYFRMILFSMCSSACSAHFAHWENSL